MLAGCTYRHRHLLNRNAKHKQAIHHHRTQHFRHLCTTCFEFNCERWVPLQQPQQLHWMGRAKEIHTIKSDGMHRHTVRHIQWFNRIASSKKRKRKYGKTPIVPFYKREKKNLADCNVNSFSSPFRVVAFYF